MSKLIAIDIGHGSDTFERTGGKGLYVNGKKYEEHDFNSKVAVELDELLRANGFKTVMKQKPFSPEVYLTDRTNYYNAKGVDLVWSIHANANSKDEVEGRCAFYWNTSEDAKRLAELYADECHKADFETHGNGLHASRLDSWTNFHICRETNMTAVLTENGFMTNNEPGTNDDFELVFGSKQTEYVKDIARVHAKAIARFFDVNFKDKKTEPASTTKVESVVVSTSVVDYMESRDMDSSFSNRAKLANEFGIGGYKGSATQNLELLDALQEQTKSAYDGDSIVAYLKSINEDYGYSHRADLADSYGFDGYKGSASQNLQLLELLRGGVKSDTSDNGKTLYLPANVDTWNVYKLNVQPVSKNAEWALTPSAFGGLSYEILAMPYPDVATIETSRGKRNIYVAPSTGAIIQ